MSTGKSTIKDVFIQLAIYVVKFFGLRLYIATVDISFLSWFFDAFLNLANCFWSYQIKKNEGTETSSQPLV